MIEITFLGTGSAVPTLRRNHPSVFLRYNEENILFDCGEGTQKQFRKARLNPCKLTKLFITHWHGDHVLGIPGLLQTLVLNNYNRKLEVYGPKGTKQYMSRILDMFIHTGKIEIIVKEIDEGEIFNNNNFSIVAEKMDHGTPCLAYSFIEKDKLRIDKKKLKKLKLPHSPLLKELKNGKDIVLAGKKIKAKEIIYSEKGKKVTLVLDTKMNSKIIKFAKDSDIFICESTYLDEKELAEDYKHLTVLDASQIAEKAGVKKLILMHLSQKYENSDKEFLSVAKKIFNNTIVAEDMLQISF